MELKEIDIDGNQLKKLREGKKLTYKEVADAVGVERGTIYNYEVGNAAPSSKVLARLCIFFDVPVTALTNAKNFSKSVSF